MRRPPVEELKERYNAAFRWSYPDPDCLRAELEKMGWTCETEWPLFAWGLLVTACWNPHDTGSTADVDSRENGQ